MPANLLRLAPLFATVACVSCSGGGGGSSSEAPAPGSTSPGPAEPPPPPPVPAADTSTGHPVMFVTSVPGTGFKHQLNTFANHGTDITDSVPGGDLYLRYA